jgi:hypothetical protein
VTNARRKNNPTIYTLNTLMMMERRRRRGGYTWPVACLLTTGRLII